MTAEGRAPAAGGLTAVSDSPSSLADLNVDRVPRPWRVDLVLDDVGGGRQSLAGLDAIGRRPDATGLVISGLDQTALETLVRCYGAQFSGINFWKCPRITDLTPLEDLPNLKLVRFFWNQRTDRLWDFSRNPWLRCLQFEDFTRLHDVHDLRRATSLEELEFGDAVWRTSVFRSLSPLESLPQLKSLAFNPKLIEDRRIQPLAELPHLQSLLFPSNLFATQQVAWLRARLPISVSSQCLEPVWTLKSPIGEGSQRRDVLVVGKGKPFLNSEQDASRIQRYIDDFWRLVEEFRQDPERHPETPASRARGAEGGAR